MPGPDALTILVRIREGRLADGRLVLQAQDVHGGHIVDLLLMQRPGEPEAFDWLELIARGD